MKNVIIVGKGIVAETFMREYKEYSPMFNFINVGTDEYLNTPHIIADAIISCGSKSREIAHYTPDDIPLIDLSPTFRFEFGWHYGFIEFLGKEKTQLLKPKRICNPGCIATAANLMLFPLKKILPANTPLYLDVTGGWSMAGSKNKPQERMAALNKPHPHISEIEAFCGLKPEENPIWLHPKVDVSFERGMRVAIPLPNISIEEIYKYWDIFLAHEENIIISKTYDNNMYAGEYAMKSGAKLTAIPERNGTLIVCQLDNLLKGSVETALLNLNIVLAD